MVPQQLLDQGSKDQVVAAIYKHSNNQKAHRNGHREIILKTIRGDLTLSKPQIRVS